MMFWLVLNAIDQISSARIGQTLFGQTQLFHLSPKGCAGNAHDLCSFGLVAGHL
jgi:hypothetical protein